MLFTALHRLLGRPPGPVTDALLDAAIAAELAETDDLDWKGELPPTSNLALTDFPKDIAAMANSGGGVIVYGVTEAEKRANGRKDTGELTENHERTLRAAAYGAIVPPVFGLIIERVGDAGNRAVAIVVPASTDGPHLLFKDKFFGAPLRNDADTEWMKERQIEASYRSRLERRRRSAEALESLYDEAETSWVRANNVWLVAAAQPRLQVVGVEPPSRGQVHAIFHEAGQLGSEYSGGGIHPHQVIDGTNPRPGLRRWVAVNTAVSDGMAWRSAWAAVHHDGAVSLAARVGGHRTSSEPNKGNVIISTAIENVIADFMGLIRAAAKHFGASEYDVRVGLEWRGSGVAGTPFGSVTIVTEDKHGFTYNEGSTPLPRFTPVLVTVTADAAPEDFYWQVHDLAQDCVNQGGIALVRTISPPPRDES